MKKIKSKNQEISVLKHYLIDKKDYLIIAINSNMIIYDLDINQIKYIIEIFNFHIDKVLLINDNNMHYFILNHINFSLDYFGFNKGKQNKVYDFNSGKFISNINTTENDICYNNIHWKNDFIIKCCKTYIKVINFKTSELYGQFNNNFNNFDGYFNYKNNILIVYATDTFNVIHFYDLDQKLLLKQIELKDKILIKPASIFKWNKNIIIINCCKKMLIIDIPNMQIINVFYFNNQTRNFIKKVKNKEYGECLLNLK